MKPQQGSWQPPLAAPLQAVLDVLCPLLERRYAAEGAQLAAGLRQRLQGVERGVLEVRSLPLLGPKLQIRIGSQHPCAPHLPQLMELKLHSYACAVACTACSSTGCPFTLP